MAENNKFEIWGMPLLAEFIGQLMFAFLHCMSANTIGITDSVKDSPIPPAITDGIFVTITVMTIGHISGAHVNSAVTVGVTLSGGLKPMMFPLYIIVQLIGSIAGAGLAMGVNGQATGAFGLGENVSVGQGVLCEILLTFELVFTVLMCAVDQGLPTGAFAIGFSIMIDIFAGFSTTGACMNPSLSFGPAIVSGKWNDYWVYWIGPIIGALIAAAVYRLGLGSREKRFLFKGVSEQNDTRRKRCADGGEESKSNKSGI